MNATELFLKSGESAGIYFCGKCHEVRRSQALAEHCCKNYLCATCGKDTGGRSWLVCDSCRAKAEEEKARARFEKAEKLTDWDGWVCDGNDYFESVEEMRERYEEESRKMPEYVWACKEKHFVQVDIDDITERMSDDAYEDWDPDDLRGLPELEAALRAFENANEDVVSYSPDYRKAVLVATIEKEAT